MRSRRPYHPSREKNGEQVDVDDDEDVLMILLSTPDTAVKKLFRDFLHKL